MIKGEYRLLQVTSCYYRLLQVTRKVLQVTTGYYRLLQLIIGYCRLLQDSTDFTNYYMLLPQDYASITLAPLKPAVSSDRSIPACLSQNVKYFSVSTCDLLSEL